MGYGTGFFLFVLFIPLFTIGWNTWKIIVYYRRTRRFIKVPGTVIGIDVTTASSLRTEGAGGGPKGEYLEAAVLIVVGLAGIFTIYYLAQYGGPE